MRVNLVFLKTELHVLGKPNFSDGSQAVRFSQIVQLWLNPLEVSTIVYLYADKFPGY